MSQLNVSLTDRKECAVGALAYAVVFYGMDGQVRMKLKPAVDHESEKAVIANLSTAQMELWDPQEKVQPVKGATLKVSV